MKKKILALGLVLALLATMALPMAVFAVDVTTGGTNVTGTLAETFTLQAPTSFTLGTAGVLHVGSNLGSATEGSVVTNVAGWSLAVTDTTSDFMQISDVGVGGTGTIGDPLTTAIQVGMTSDTLTTILLYEDQLHTVTGVGSGYYGNIGTFNIHLYANQTVLATDAAGVYSISLTYTATPGIGE